MALLMTLLNTRIIYDGLNVRLQLSNQLCNKIIQQMSSKEQFSNRSQTVSSNKMNIYELLMKNISRIENDRKERIEKHYHSEHKDNTQFNIKIQYERERLTKCQQSSALHSQANSKNAFAPFHHPIIQKKTSLVSHFRNIDAQHHLKNRKVDSESVLITKNKLKSLLFRPKDQVDQNGKTDKESNVSSLNKINKSTQESFLTQLKTKSNKKTMEQIQVLKPKLSKPQNQKDRVSQSNLINNSQIMLQPSELAYLSNGLNEEEQEIREAIAKQLDHFLRNKNQNSHQFNTELLRHMRHEQKDNRYKANKQRWYEKKCKIKALNIIQIQGNYDQYLKERDFVTREKKKILKSIKSMKGQPSKLISLITSHHSPKKSEEIERQLLSEAEDKKRVEHSKTEHLGLSNAKEDLKVCQIQINHKNSQQQSYQKHRLQIVERVSEVTIHKLKKIYNFNRLILSSNACYMPKQKIKQMDKFHRKEVTYSYYVGPGNNRNLIQALMKRRWWWKVTNEIKNANFVWTQLKIETVLEREKSICSQQTQENNDQAIKKLTEIKDIVSSSKSKRKNEKQIALRKIFHTNFSKKYQHLSFSEKEEALLLKKIKPIQVIHNHYKQNYMIGNKKALLKILRLYVIKHLGKSLEELNQLIPLTFHVENLKCQEYQQFESIFRCNHVNSKRNVWIVKPGQNSNRGNGIFVCNSLEEIRKEMLSKNSNKQTSIDTEFPTLIIQSYISNLLLYNNRKFDLRVYLLLTTVGGVKKFYFYSEGYIRTSSEIYSLANISNKFIHLTNDAIQSTGQNYGKYQKGNKLSYSEFQKYIDMKYYGKQYKVEKLVDEMKRIAGMVAKASYPVIDSDRKSYGMELFGMDFIIDEDFRPWLLEVNTNPCLELSAPLLERLIPNMLENMLRMTIDPLLPPNILPSKEHEYYIPENPLQNNKFQLIFDQLFDQDLEWEDICKQQMSKAKYQDDNEVYEDEGANEQYDINI